MNTEGMLPKLLTILDVVGNGDCGSLTDIAEKTGLPRSTVHRLVTQMIESRLLRRIPENLYELGDRLFELGSRVPRYQRLRQVSQPAIRRLLGVTGRIVHLAVLDAGQVVFLDKLVPNGAPGTPSKPGGRLPAHCTAVGKMLLASLDDDDLATVISHPLEGMTPHSITGVRRLYGELVRVRLDGFSIERDESHVGIACVAYPIRTGRYVVGAISVATPSEDVGNPLLAEHLRTAAAGTSRLVSAEETFLGLSGYA